MNKEKLIQRIADAKLTLQAETALKDILSSATSVDGHLMRRFNRTNAPLKATFDRDNYAHITIECNGKMLLSCGFYMLEPYMNGLRENIQNRIDASVDSIRILEKQLENFDVFEVTEAKALKALEEIFRFTAKTMTEFTEALQGQPEYQIDFTVLDEMQAYKIIKKMADVVGLGASLVTVHKIITADYTIIGRNRKLTFDVYALPEDIESAVQKQIEAIHTDYKGIVTNIQIV